MTTHNYFGFMTAAEEVLGRKVDLIPDEILGRKIEKFVLRDRVLIYG